MKTARHFGVGKLGMATSASAGIISDLQGRNALGVCLHGPGSSGSSLLWLKEFSA